MIGPPVTVVGPAIVAIAHMLALLPKDAGVLLIGWILGSFPIGVLFGHFVLRDK